MHFFCTYARISPPVAGLLWRVLLRGTQEPGWYTAVHVWAPAGLRGACSRRLKSRNLALFHGIAFRLVEPRRTLEKPRLTILALSLLYHVYITCRFVYAVHY